MSNGDIVIVGAGGHAKIIVELLGEKVRAYSDEVEVDWLNAKYLGNDDVAVKTFVPNNFIMGLGGSSWEELERRMVIFRRYIKSGRNAPPICHPNAIISESAKIDQGAVILAGAIVQPNAFIGEAAIVNTGAIIEHDTHIGAGSHIAPRSVVLGGASVGKCSMVGAGAIVLPRSKVGNRKTISANSLFHSKEGHL